MSSLSRTLLLFSLIALLSPSTVLNAQELYCNVQVSAQKLQGSNRDIFQNMQKDIYEFMNNTVWTENVFSYSERIQCNIIINLTEQLSSEVFNGTLQIQLSRPVYNTTYESTVLNFVDNNFQFNYVEFQPLQYNPNAFSNNLVSVMAYYAYLLIGVDYDTFSNEGGTQYFQVAERIVNNAQNATEAGWKPYDGSRNRNRYWLVKNILNKEYSGVRQFLYQYYIKGMDQMESNPTEARRSIYESLKSLQETYRRHPDPYMYYMSLITEAKVSELVSIFTPAFPEEKNRVVEILTEIDPGNETKYKAILKSN
jgi:hypothetical protein